MTHGTRKATRPARPLGGLTVTRIIREHHPLITHDEGTLSIGQMIDEHLNNAAQRGESIQQVELCFEPEQREEIASTVYCGFVDSWKEA